MTVIDGLLATAVLIGLILNTTLDWWWADLAAAFVIVYYGVLPLGLDTFAVSAALGVAGLPKQQRLKISLLLSGFEMAMPVIGLLVGRTLGHVAAAALFALGAWMLVSDEQDEAGEGRRPICQQRPRVGRPRSQHQPRRAGDGLHDRPASPLNRLGCDSDRRQAFLVAQLGLRLGARLGEAARETAEKIAGLALIGLGVLVLVEQLA